ncbi:MAG: hypothetical protein AAGG68_01930 [Bacteroidota bacterium]
MVQDNNTYTKRFRRNYRKGTMRYKLSSFWLGYPFELRDRLLNAFGNKNQPEKKFVIFTSGRSGSTLLVDLLNSSPEIQCDDELLKRRVAFPISLVKSFEQQSKKEIYGFKLLSYQLLNVQTGIKNKQVFLEKLIHEEDYQLIHLSRDNKAKQALSIIYAFYRRQWHNQQDSQQKEAKRFELDTETYLHFLGELQVLEDFEQAMVSNFDHLSLTYEEDLRQPRQYEQSMQRVSEYLGTEIVHPETNLRKVTPSRLSDMISNQEDLIKAVRNSKFEEYAMVLEQM